MVDQSERILVVEEGYPLIEKRLRGLSGIPGKTIMGKLSGDFPITGELSPGIVRTALGIEPLPKQKLEGFDLSGRPPQLCQGCPHTDTFNVLKRALENYDRDMYTWSLVF
ncbi:hypothetical protein ACFLT9_08200 [Acidobacteriota bacterium]